MKLHEINNYGILSKNQKRVISVIQASATPQLAYDQIRRDEALRTAAIFLQRIKAVTVYENGISLTERGEELAIANNITPDQLGAQ